MSSLHASPWLSSIHALVRGSRLRGDRSVKLFMVAWSVTRHPIVEVWQGSALDKPSHPTTVDPTTVELAGSPQSGCGRRSHRGSGIEVRMHIREREHWPRPSSRYLQSSSPRACGVAPTHLTSAITSRSMPLAPTAASPVCRCGEVAYPVLRPSELRIRCRRCSQTRPNQDDTQSSSSHHRRMAYVAQILG
jgi:hypothetical protein